MGRVPFGIFEASFAERDVRIRRLPGRVQRRAACTFCDPLILFAALTHFSGPALRLLV